MEQIRNAAAFAITLEPEGNSKNPTLEVMSVLMRSNGETKMYSKKAITVERLWRVVLHKF